ncbi:hypothetical protein [Haladaptatus cibarius]|uniref:hypothetical protein n=1 Tax=Haladaptatus cibarius TaxID=453847 RepID=UPI00130DA57F|nr:hypothetical protein [Haladaptatus cibarius]
MMFNSRDVFTIGCGLFGGFTGGLLWILLGSAELPVGPGIVWSVTGLLLGAYSGTRTTSTDA